jgi:hypothetical protein
LIELEESGFGLILGYRPSSCEEFLIDSHSPPSGRLLWSFKYKEEEIVRRFLQVLPPRFGQIATSIETLVDLETITVNELIGHLKPSEEQINRGGGSTIASLNLTEDELIAKITSRLKIAGGGNTDQQKEASSPGGKRRRGHGRGHGKGT